MKRPPGYAEQAEELVKRYEAVPFAEKHRAILHLLPKAPGWVLDIGAGTGADAAWFASGGHQVVAVEPTGELRCPGMALHPSPSIEWIDDQLPGLASVLARGQRFETIMLIAVWMHLDEEERRIAMANVACLLAPRGVIIMTLRHGPVPAGRRMFAVTGEETIALARSHGLRAVLDSHSLSAQAVNRAAGVTWTSLAFEWAPRGLMATSPARSG